VKVLVATAETQGKRANDYIWATPGELVFFGVVCDSDEGNPDGKCGCDRSMSGMDSLKSTTTVRVMERSDVNPELLRLAIRQALVKGQWDTLYKDALEEFEILIDSQVEDLTAACEAFSEGAVLEYRSYEFTRRD